MRKIAVVGTSCAGKTTLVYTAAAALKARGALVETVTSSDRRHPFNSERLDWDLDAQGYLLFNQLLLEEDRVTRAGANLVLCDRSSIDLWLMAELRTLTDESAMTPTARALRSLAYDWSKTYHALLYAPPLPYQNDRARLADEERLSIEPKMRRAITWLPNAILLPDDPDLRLEVLLRYATVA